MERIGPQTCDRCDTHTDDALIDDAYLVDADTVPERPHNHPYT